MNFEETPWQVWFSSQICPSLPPVPGDCGFVVLQSCPDPLHRLNFHFLDICLPPFLTPSVCPYQQEKQSSNEQNSCLELSSLGCLSELWCNCVILTSEDISFSTCKMASYRYICYDWVFSTCGPLSCNSTNTVRKTSNGVIQFVLLILLQQIHFIHWLLKSYTFPFLLLFD